MRAENQEGVEVSSFVPLAFVETSTQAGSTARIPIGKRIFDVVAASVLLLAVLPLMLMVAGWVVTTSRGPALFRQERFGLGGERFTILKFRTMQADAESQLRRLIATDPDLAQEMAQTWKLRQDPRLAPGGAVLRRLSLDELPQLINVIRGEMSLVGPRPRRDPAELRSYGNELHVLFGVAPGLTGPWQVGGRNDLSEAERARLDIDYARHRTFRSDLALLWRTIPVVLLPSRSGTY